MGWLPAIRKGLQLAAGTAAGVQAMRGMKRYAASKMGQRKRPRLGIKKKVKGKGGRSKTITTTKRKKPKGKTIQSASYNQYETNSRLTYKRPKMAKTLMWTKQPLTLEMARVFACVTEANIGNPATQFPGRLRQGTNLVTSINSAANTAILSSALITELWDRHSIARNKTGGGAWISYDASATAKHQSVFVKHCQMKWTFTNQAPISTDVELWIVQRKTSVKTYQVDGPLLDWQVGLDEEQADGGKLLIDNWEGKPTNVKRFNMNWRVVKCVKMRLEPGQEAKHVHEFGVNRLIDLGHANQYLGGISGIHHESFLIARGAIGDNLNNFNTESITSSRPKIVGVQKLKYTAYAVQNYPKITYQSSNLANNLDSVYHIADAAGTVVNTEIPSNYA